VHHEDARRTLLVAKILGNSTDRTSENPTRELPRIYNTGSPVSKNITGSRKPGMKPVRDSTLLLEVFFTLHTFVAAL
jgi:hypothetical protein